mmetsp:Transcript_51627/g.136364  ORF Transcript_51627/g.136364 Transcript_51627/m.136364 type:complete len:221 (-) Transcript_51627:87-749(-)
MTVDWKDAVNGGTGRDDARCKSLGLLPAFLLIPRAFGFLFAWLIAHFGSNVKYVQRIAALSASDIGYLAIGAVVFSILVAFLNMYPTIYKSQVFSDKAGNLKANMQLFKINTPQQQYPYVVLEDEGTVGEYNRANRSLHHFAENCAGFVLCFLVAGMVFPLPAMIIVCIFAFARILHQVGYAEKGYGGHALGFVIAMLCTVTMEMLVLLIAIGALGGWQF